MIKDQKKNSLDTHNTKLTVQQTLAEPKVIHTWYTHTSTNEYCLVDCPLNLTRERILTNARTCVGQIPTMSSSQVLHMVC